MVFRNITFSSNKNNKPTMQKYQILGVIGEGAYGVVLRCRHIQTKEILAIKKFKESEEDQNVKKTTVREVKILKALEHANIVKLKEAFRKKGIVYLVFEYVNNNLLEVLEKQPSGLHPQIIKQIIYQTLKGIAYLHVLNIVHRDIKPENLLVSDQMIVKICDFGFAKILKPDRIEMTDYVATRWYRSPQLLVGAPYSKQVDIWALGCIFAELIDGNPLFPGQNQLDQLFLIQKCLGNLTQEHNQIFMKNQRFMGMKFPQINSLESIQKRYLGRISQKGLNLIKGMLKLEPKERINAIDALKHSYFDDIRQQDFIRRLTIVQGNQNRVTSACETGYQKKRNHIQSNIEQQKDNHQHQTRGTKIKFPKKEDTSRSSNLKINVQAQHSKSTNKNTGYTKKPKDTTLSLQKHHNRDILVKTQAGFFISPNMQQNGNAPRNKIYGANKISPKSKQGSRKNKNEEGYYNPNQEHMNSTSGGFPFLVIGNQPKTVQKHQKTEKPSQKYNASSSNNGIFNSNHWNNNLVRN